MENIFGLLLAIFGWAAGYATCVLVAAGKAEAETRQSAGAEANPRLAWQYRNFLAYDGTERGQMDLENQNKP